MRTFLWRNIALVAAATPFVLAGIRVLLYSGGDPVVLRTLLETLNVPTVLLGTFVPLLPAFVLIFIQAVMFNGSWASGLLKTRWGKFSLGIFAIVYAFLTPFPSGVWSIAALFGGALLGEITWRIIRRHFRKHPVATPAETPAAAPLPSAGSWFFRGGSPYIVIGVVTSLLLTLPFGMWVPLERLTLASGSKVITYVLDESDSWTTTIAADKSIRIIASKTIVRRSVCKQGQFTSLLTMIGHSHPSPNDKCKT